MDKLFIILLISMGFCVDVTLSITAIADDGAGNVVFDIYMKNEVGIASFQFNLKTDSTDIMSFRSFCSYEDSCDEGFFSKDLCESTGEYDWMTVASPDSGRADTSNIIVHNSIQGNFYGYSSSLDDSIAIGEGILTRVSAYYDPGSINDTVNVSFIKPNCDPNADGIVDQEDITNIAGIISNIDSFDSCEACINLTANDGQEVVFFNDLIIWNNIKDQLGGNVELRIADSDGNEIADVELISVNWVVGQGILLEGCTDDTACNYDVNANMDDGTCEYAAENYDCDGNCIVDIGCAETGLFGCTDDTACNYDANANMDNDTCEYSIENYDCDGNCIADVGCDGECGSAGVPAGTCDCDGSLDNCNLCLTVDPTAYGNCNDSLGYAFTGEDCTLIEGCGYGNDQDLFSNTSEDCVGDCQNCQVIVASDYGSCEVELGWAWTGGICELILGCGKGDDGPWFYKTADICNVRCSYDATLKNETIKLPHYYTLTSYPNPFNPNITISFNIPEFGFTMITAYTISGRELEILTSSHLNPGNYSIDWNASLFPSGIYLIRMESGGFSQIQKVALIK